MQPEPRSKNTSPPPQGVDFITFLDPFAGGGSIPLEAQRLGLEAHAHDLNPVAVLINKAMIEIPPRFAGCKPVNPEARNRLGQDREWSGSEGLAEDVRYYAERLKEEAYKKIGHLYPKVQLPAEMGGGEATVIAWIWARTVKCPNPACGSDIPLANSYILSKKKEKKGNKKGKVVYIKLTKNKNKIEYSIIKENMTDKEVSIKEGRGGNFKCPFCNSVVNKNYIHNKFKDKQTSSDLLAIIAEGKNGRIYLPPTDEHLNIALSTKPNWIPEEDMNEENPTLVSGRGYGIKYWFELFTQRQLVMLTTLVDLCSELQNKIIIDALNNGFNQDKRPLMNSGQGALAYSQAIIIYISFIIDKLACYHSSFSTWHSSGEKMQQVFGRQAIPMVWDYAECNPFCNSSGCYDNITDWVIKCIKFFRSNKQGVAKQCDVKSDCMLQNYVISTDPPYYDNIDYADLSDFFYIWLRKCLYKCNFDFFKTIETPKKDELIASRYRFGGSKDQAKKFFIEGMSIACARIFEYARDDVPVTIYYAYKQSDSDGDEIFSTGWEVMLAAVINSGFSITGTWPIRTEMQVRSISRTGTNALSSSIVLVCRKRKNKESICSRREFLNNLKRELPIALKNMQKSNIAPVDMAQASIGPGIGIYSRFSRILEADGSEMSVRKALHIINQELDAFLTAQDSDMDEISRFCINLYIQNGFNDIKYGEADILARAKNVSIESLSETKIVKAEKGVVHLVEREKLPSINSNNSKIIWYITQLATYTIQQHGVSVTGDLLTQLEYLDRIKNLAYRLFTIADQKGWQQEAFAYNTLVVHWQDIEAKISKNKSVKKMKQGSLTSVGKG